MTFLNKWWETVTPKWKRIQAYSGDWFHIVDHGTHWEGDVTLSAHFPRVVPTEPAPFVASTQNELLLQIKKFVDRVERDNLPLGPSGLRSYGPHPVKDFLSKYYNMTEDQLIRARDTVGEWEQVTPFWSRIKSDDHWFHIYKEFGKWVGRISRSDQKGTGRLLCRGKEQLDCTTKLLAILEKAAMEVRATHDAPLRSELDHHERQLSALKEFIEWLQQHRETGLKLEVQSTSRYHHMTENIVTRDGDTMQDNPYLHEAQVFLLEHNWAAAFKGSGDYEGGEFQLPYEACAFEFRISGKNIVILASQNARDQDRVGIIMKPFIQTEAGWWTDADYSYEVVDGRTRCFSLQEMARRFPEFKINAPTVWDGVDRYAPIMDLCFPQIKAACIALEAEVAYEEVQRQPEKFVRARIKSGKKPPKDFHIVRLAKQRRAAPLPRNNEPHEPKWRVRFHWRRGHYRHYENHKTWIKWMLVGDPDLGFIEKEYRF